MMPIRLLAFALALAAGGAVAGAQYVEPHYLLNVRVSDDVPSLRLVRKGENLWAMVEGKPYLVPPLTAGTPPPAASPIQKLPHPSVQVWLLRQDGSAVKQMRVGEPMGSMSPGGGTAYRLVPWGMDFIFAPTPDSELAAVVVRVDGKLNVVPVEAAHSK